MFQVYKDNAGHWRWRYVALNSRTLADSGESYHNRADCEGAIAILKRGVAMALIKAV